MQKKKELKRLRKKQKQQKLIDEENTKQRNLEAQRIKEWEEKFDEEQQKKEQELIQKFYGEVNNDQNLNLEEPKDENK